MSDTRQIAEWPEKIRQRYENYLRTSFFFKDPELRASFQTALRQDAAEGQGGLLKGPFPEPPQTFETASQARKLARELFPGKSDDLLPALADRALYAHQETAIRGTHIDGRNIVLATGTGSGKTESFLYPILFELYRQHLAGDLDEPGVRALVLYPMNALANDQRQRLGEICEALNEAGSGFKPTFGQYIGQTPENRRDHRRNAAARNAESLPGELVFREEMRAAPPHILLTNYSMLEYLSIRPDDSPLFDGGRSAWWQFLVLDEAHQYRGAKGIEMGMLLRRLKQRLCEGGRRGPFRCIATSATLSDGDGEEDRKAVADFAAELFGESFSTEGVVFGTMRPPDPEATPKRYHAFLRALEGAFLVHRDGKDEVALNRTRKVNEDGSDSEPLEIALCRECGQHYYVGQTPDAKLIEAVRDPSQPDFGVKYYMPAEDGDWALCRRCGAISKGAPGCGCEGGAAIAVKRCESHEDRPDQLKECAACGYSRGGVGDPVQEIVHGSDGPNAVIATALHELLDKGRRRVLAFADSRQEAAFFAWYAQHSYEEVRDRNLILRAVAVGEVATEGLSIDDLGNRLLRQWDRAGLFGEAETDAARRRKVLSAILREAITDERRLSLSGVGLIEWSVALPSGFHPPAVMFSPPWGFAKEEARGLITYLLDDLRARRAMNLPNDPDGPGWADVSPWPQQAYRLGPPGRQRHVRQWGGSQTAVVKHFLARLLTNSQLSGSEKQKAAIALMEKIWHALPKAGTDSLLSQGNANGAFRLNPRWLRVRLANPDSLWECGTCATLTGHNIRDVCPRNGCPGFLRPADLERLNDNHYRRLYQSTSLPPILRAEEHTAQIDNERARDLQDKFKAGDIHLLSSSTTFEVGVDLGDLDVVFLRNVPPEAFNYTQRVGRAGRRDTPGLSVAYCRRNPHDLYHYDDPEARLIRGRTQAPRLSVTNPKIVLRHMTAVALSAFFRRNADRFDTVGSFIKDWSKPRAAHDLMLLCEGNPDLRDTMRRIVPEAMHGELGLAEDSWVANIAGPDSRLALAEAEVQADYSMMETLRNEYFRQ